MKLPKGFASVAATLLLRGSVPPPALVWTGVKDSGRGCTLSRVGYTPLTPPKSFHLRTAT